VKAGSKRSDIWEDLHWTFWFTTGVVQMRSVRESDNVGTLGKVMCHDNVTGSNRADAREVPAIDLFQREVPKLCNPSNLKKDRAKSISWITWHRTRWNPEWKRIFTWLINIHKKICTLRGLSNVTLELRVPFLAMVFVLDELRDFERRTVGLDFIAKKLCLQDYVLVEILFFTANSTAQLWGRLQYHH
jgi:hypothetical protein